MPRLLRKLASIFLTGGPQLVDGEVECPEVVTFSLIQGKGWRSMTAVLSLVDDELQELLWATAPRLLDRWTVQLEPGSGTARVYSLAGTGPERGFM